MDYRDDQLYKEDGFATWEAYCKERWEWSREHTRRLIKAAEYRALLPSPRNATESVADRAPDWSEWSVRELTRLEDKRDAAKVAAKVVKSIPSVYHQWW